MTTSQLEQPGETEVDAVRRWRFTELARAGYEHEHALELAAHAEVDLHMAVDLVRRGCSTKTALRILL